MSELNEYHPVSEAIAWHLSEPENIASFEANIEQRIKHHSPSGMSVGYGGSGVADFALNILDYRLRCLEFVSANRATSHKGNSFFGELYGLHQSFKWTFLAIASDESFIEWPIIDAWLYATCFDNRIGAHLKERVASEFRAVFTEFYDESAQDETQKRNEETARRNLIFFKSLREIARAQQEGLDDSRFAEIAIAFLARFETWRQR